MTARPQALVAERPIALPPVAGKWSADMPSIRQERLFALAFVERHLSEGQDHISKMQNLVADGERQGINMSEARILLGEFLIAQARRRQHREQILADLDGYKPNSTKPT
jgi:hypothetical protein